MDPQERFSKLYELLVTIYKFSPWTAVETIQQLEDDQAARTSPDPDVQYRQALKEARVAGERWQAADQKWQDSVDAQSAHANNPDNFRIPGLSRLAEAAKGREVEAEKLSGVRMLRNFVMAKDLQRAEEEKKDRAWVHAWGQAHAPMTDERGMIISGTGK